MTLREKQSRFWLMVSKLLQEAERLGTPLVVLEWLRSIERQKELIALKASKTMDSKHIQGLAVDVCFLDDLLDDGRLNYTADQYRAIGDFWEGLGGTWGGRFGVKPEQYNSKVGWDAGHFEYAE